MHIAIFIFLLAGTLGVRPLMEHPDESLVAGIVVTMETAPSETTTSPSSLVGDRTSSQGIDTLFVKTANKESSSAAASPVFPYSPHKNSLVRSQQHVHSPLTLDTIESEPSSLVLAGSNNDHTSIDYGIETTIRSDFTAATSLPEHLQTNAALQDVDDIVVEPGQVVCINITQEAWEVLAQLASIGPRSSSRSSVSSSPAAVSTLTLVSSMDEADASTSRPPPRPSALNLPAWLHQGMWNHRGICGIPFLQDAGQHLISLPITTNSQDAKSSSNKIDAPYDAQVFAIHVQAPLHSSRTSSLKSFLSRLPLRSKQMPSSFLLHSSPDTMTSSSSAPLCSTLVGRAEMHAWQTDFLNDTDFSSFQASAILRLHVAELIAAALRIDLDSLRLLAITPNRTQNLQNEQSSSKDLGRSLECFP